MSEPGAMPSSMYVFPSDLVEEGAAVVGERLRALGITSMTLAHAYHQARDVTPHVGASSRLRYRRDGLFASPTPGIWADSRLRPDQQAAEEIAAVASIRETAGLPVEAWTVFLHNTTLGERHPEVTSRTCFGDRLVANLCPAHPDARHYALNLAREVASRGVDVVAETLNAQTFGHGHHHERTFTPISAGDEALLGLCFCGHCAALAGERGVDAPALAERVRARIDAAYAGALGLPATIEALADAVGPDVLGLIAAREDAVARLAAEVAAVVRAEGQRLTILDVTGAVLGYGDGVPTGAAAPTQAWQLSINVPAVAANADAYSVLGYTRDPERLASDVAAYRSALGATPLRVVLRPGYPDTDDAGHLADKVVAARAAGADRIDFYNYGMSPEPVLARIPRSLGLST